MLIRYDYGLKYELSQLWNRLDFDNKTDLEKKTTQGLIKTPDTLSGFDIGSEDNALYYNQLSKYKLISSIFLLKNMLKQLDFKHSLDMFKDDNSREAQYYRIFNDYRDIYNQSVLNSKIFVQCSPICRQCRNFLKYYQYGNH